MINFDIVEESIIRFLCQRCQSKTMYLYSYLGTFNQRTFCSCCGACYVIFRDDDSIVVQSIQYEEMYMPPIEWNNLYYHGFENGMHDEVRRRHERTFRERLMDFIYNR